jgi:hypothetical protein
LRYSTARTTTHIEEVEDAIGASPRFHSKFLPQTLPVEDDQQGGAHTNTSNAPKEQAVQESACEKDSQSNPYFQETSQVHSVGPLNCWATERTNADTRSPEASKMLMLESLLRVLWIVQELRFMGETAAPYQ